MTTATLNGDELRLVPAALLAPEDRIDLLPIALFHRDFDALYENGDIHHYECEFGHVIDVEYINGCIVVGMLNLGSWVFHPDDYVPVKVEPSTCKHCFGSIAPDPSNTFVHTDSGLAGCGKPYSDHEFYAEP